MPIRDNQGHCTAGYAKSMGNLVIEVELQYLLGD